MSGPWEKYAATTPAAQDTGAGAGPWSRYASQSAADQVPGGGVAGNRNVGKPVVDERPINGIDIALGRKGLAGDVFDKALGVPDAVLSAGSAAAAGIIGSVAGAGKSLVGGKFGTPQGAQEGEEFGSHVAEKIMRPPSTQTGRAILESLGTATAPLAALPSAEIANLGRAAASANTGLRSLAFPSAAVQDAADAAVLANGQKGRLRDLMWEPKPSMSGVGAAATPEVTQRIERAAALPVPIKLTKGQRTRDFDQTAFEQETAKQPEGAPLRRHVVEQNQQLLQNFDAFRDMTGAEAPNLRVAGSVVDAALVKKYKAAKAEVNGAYSAARDAGELVEPVPYKGLSDYLDKHSAAIETNNVPMLAAVRRQLEKLDPDGRGVIPLNDMEELRKMAGRLTQDGTPNAAHVGDVKRIIDAATESAGGDLYREARRLNTNMARQFENAGVIDKLLRTKSGTNDRAVALEDVVDHAIFNGSLDDVRQMRRVLQAGAGEDGSQAWRELQGGTIDRLRDTMFPAGGAANTASDTVARYSQFARLVSTLDKDGRLDFVFGKQGAAQVRDFTKTAQDILTAPPGSSNPSGTSSALLRAWNKAAAVLGSTPGTSHAAGYLDKRVQSAVLRRRVDSAVNPDGQK